MPRRQPSLPDIWLISDVRNDARLDAALARLPRGSGMIYRHYHLNEGARRERFEDLARIARARSHVLVLAGTAHQAQRWGAHGAYGASEILAPGPAILRLATAHSLGEIGTANRIRADAVLLSPVYPTRSHPGAQALGAVGFRLLAPWSQVPVIALGGMNPARSQALQWKKWAAIDGV